MKNLEENSEKKNIAISNPESQEVIDSIKKLDSEDKQELVSRMKISSIRYSGPIPNPEILKGFEDVCKGSANRIIKMAEQQSEHRQFIEKKKTNEQSRNSLLGMTYGFIIAIISILSGVILIVLDKGPQGLTIIAGIIVSLVGLFVYGTKIDKKDKNDKT